MERRTLALLFISMMALCALVTKTHVVSWNDGSRIATVDALTERGTFQIDGSPFEVNLGDKVRYQGRTYSDKSPLLAVLGAAVMVAVRPLGISLQRTPGIAIYLTTLLTVGVWFALGCCYAYAFQRYLGYRPRVALAVAVLTGTATLALPYATVLTNHVPAGAAGLAGALHCLLARAGRWPHAALAGLFFALAFGFDPAAIVFVLLAVLLLWGAPARMWFTAAAAALPLVALQFVYTATTTGSILPPVFNAYVWGDASLPLHAEPVLPVFRPVEYVGFAVNLLVGSRGLFLFTPLMLAAAYGFVRMWRAGGVQRQVAVGVVSTFVLFFALIVFLQNDNHARHYGERRYVNLFFLLGIGLGPALVAARERLAALSLRLAIVTSMASAALGSVAPFAGNAGESGFVFGAAEFVALLHRAPVQAALDVVLLLAGVAVVLRLAGAAPAERELSAA